MISGAHDSKLERSWQLQAILAMLQDRGQQGATTKEIADSCHVENAATWISNLRRNGMNIHRDYVGLINGSKVHRYTLIPPDRLF